MKRLKYPLLFTIFLSLISIPTIQAQFLKKLKNRVEQKVENINIKKTADKAAEKTSKSMDKIFNTNPFGVGRGKASPNLIAESYVFSWKYSLKMTTKEGEMVLDYYLNPGAAYFGFTTVAMKDIFTVMDNDNKIMAMFMSTQGNNMVMANQMPDDLNLEEDKDKSDNFNFQSLPEKIINGYHCKGVKAINSEYEMDMYFTDEAEVSFDDIYKNQQTKIPVQLKNYFNKDDKVLMIYMDMKGLKSKKQNAQIECIGLEKVSKTISKSEYKSM